MNKDILNSYHLNHFLLVITEPISKYLENLDFLQINPEKSLFYCSWDPRDTQSSLTKYATLFEKTEIAANSINSILGCGCERCDKPFHVYDMEVREKLDEYVPLLISAWNIYAFEAQLKQSATEFQEDFLFWLKKFNTGESSLAIVEQQLLLWQDAIPDELLINALLSVRFDFISRALLKTHADE